MPVQTVSWHFDADVVSRYSLAVVCTDSRPGGADTDNTVITLIPNQAPVITNIPGMKAKKCVHDSLTLLFYTY